MRHRLKRTTLILALGLLLLAGCGRPSSATVLPLPNEGTTVAFQATQTALPNRLDGTPEPTPLPVQPNLPPGSGRLLYDSDAARIVPASGGPAVPWSLANGDQGWKLYGAPLPWSPDASMLMLIRAANPSTDLSVQVADADGANVREVARIPSPGLESLRRIVWSPDSRKAAFILEQSKKNAFGAERKRLMVVDVAGGSAVPVADDINLSDLFLAWSPDSTSIVYSTTTGSDPDAPPTVQTVRWDGTERKTLITGIKTNGLFWLSDGSILFESDCDGSGYTVLCRLDPVSGAYQPLYQAPERPASLGFYSISPDQEWLVAADYGRNTVFVFNLRTGALDTISTERSYFLSNGIVWSPDSKYLALWADDRLTYVHELGSGQPLRPLISGYVLGWFPDE